MDLFWILTAFICGAASRKLGLPPLVGYLIAGFVIKTCGVESTALLESIADIGVNLLLFTIGLKLRLKLFTRAAIWVGTTLHMLLIIIIFGVGIWILNKLGFSYFQLLSLKAIMLIAFALSFSSTIFAVKIFEGKKELTSQHANTAIGILIIQDIIAVIFLALANEKMPSQWTVMLLLSLFIIRPLFIKLMDQQGHGELMILFGILMTLAGYNSFELVGLKGNLGALIFGMLLASHPKSSELADRLLDFKDLFLVGFFLNIGMFGLPNINGFLIALLLTLAIPFKAALFFLMLTRFKLRARTSMLASLSLANYSEFGLIVGSICVNNGWIISDWLVIIAIALSMSFILAAPLNSAAHTIYTRFADYIKLFETDKRLPEDEPIETGEASIAIIGMGNLGTSAYDEMRRRHGNVVVGVDFCTEKVEKHREVGRNIIYGDAEDSDFWERIKPENSRINLIMLALPGSKASIFVIRYMKQKGYQGKITASVHYDDEISLLKKEGINAVYSLYEEAGVGFADHVCNYIGYCNFNTKNLP